MNARTPTVTPNNGHSAEAQRGFEGRIGAPASNVAHEPDLTGRGGTLKIDGQGFEGNVRFSALVGGLINTVNAMTPERVAELKQARQEHGLTAGVVTPTAAAPAAAPRATGVQVADINKMQPPSPFSRG